MDCFYLCCIFAPVNAEDMKKWLIAIDIIAVLLMVVFAAIGLYQSKSKEYDTAIANVKAYDSYQTGELSNKALQLKVEQLEYFNDSILRSLDSTRKELGIKDKNLKALLYIKSSITKADTITLVDTIFKDTALDIDTACGDAWYRTRVELKYPNFIAVTPFFISKKSVVVSLRKETVNPPKKFWLFRWFQKKHKVVIVDITEENPYVEDEESRYVEIIK